MITTTVIVIIMLIAGMIGTLGVLFKAIVKIIFSIVTPQEMLKDLFETDVKKIIDTEEKRKKFHKDYFDKHPLVRNINTVGNHLIATGVVILLSVFVGLSIGDLFR